MKIQGCSYANRAGNARLSGVLLGIGALVAACVAGYALWTLTPTSSGPGEVDPDEVLVQDQGLGHGQGIAKTESVEEILGAVQVYVRNEQFAQAITVLEHAAAQYSSDQEVQFALGDLYMLEERYSEAYTQYVIGIEIGPSTAMAELTAGTLANMLDRLELSEMHFIASMRMDQTNPDTPMYLAAVQMKMNRLAQAKTNLAKAGKLSPDRAKVYVMRSEIAMRENKVQIALEQIRRARAIEPRELAWLLQEARVLKRAGKAEDAINLLTSLAQEQLEIPESVYILAECYGMMGRPGDAASRLMDVAAKYPDDAKLAFEVALWLERTGDRPAAIEWATKAHSLGHAQAQGWVESLP